MLLRNFAIFLLLLFSTSVQAQITSLSNAGIIPSNIWFSEEPFFAGEKVRIYTIIYNESDHDLTGGVEFYDNGKPIKSSSFSIVNGGVRDVWVDWTASEGSHKITASIINARSSVPGEEEKEVTLINNQTGISERFVDLDTDGDRIGNRDDDDDDNDGLSDDKEALVETDPLNPDTDNDGIIDGEDPNPKIQNESNSETENIADKIPSSVTKAAEPVLNATNSFRESQLTKIEKRIIELEEQIEKSRTAENGSDTESEPDSTEFESSFGKIWRWIVLWTNKFLRFVFSSSFVFHVIAAMLLIPVIRWIFKLLFLPFKRR